jgi:hypothetical protein
LESLRDKLIAIIKNLPEDKLQAVLDFVNRINYEGYGNEDYDELLMGDKITPDRFC